MSFAVLYKIYTSGKWSGMPMDVIRQLSVTFPDCSESSVLDAVTVVTLMSYNFPTGEKQHGLLVRSFVEQYKKIYFRGVYLVLQFLIADNISRVSKVYELKNVLSTAKYSLFLLSRSTEFRHIFFLDFSVFFSLSASEFHQKFRTVLLVCGFASVVSALLLPTTSFPTNQFQDSRFMTCFSFSEDLQSCFFFSFFSFPKRLNKACA